MILYLGNQFGCRHPHRLGYFVDGIEPWIADVPAENMRNIAPFNFRGPAYITLCHPLFPDKPLEGLTNNAATNLAHKLSFISKAAEDSSRPNFTMLFPVVN